MGKRFVYTFKADGKFFTHTSFERLDIGELKDLIGLNAVLFGMNEEFIDSEVEE